MSARALRITLLVLTLIGTGVASYLTYIHYAGINPVCTGGESCLKVQTSVYSKLAGIPVAVMGLVGYFLILISLLLRENETTRFATAALTFGGFGFSAYLTYRELFSIHAICEWCASSAVIMTIMTVLSVWRYLRGDSAPGAVRPPAGNVPAQEPAAPVGSAS
jgi:uncharacterized membrane protein